MEGGEETNKKMEGGVKKIGRMVGDGFIKTII